MHLSYIALALWGSAITIELNATFSKKNTEDLKKTAIGTPNVPGSSLSCEDIESLNDDACASADSDMPCNAAHLNATKETFSSPGVPNYKIVDAATGYKNAAIQYEDCPKQGTTLTCQDTAFWFFTHTYEWVPTGGAFRTDDAHYPLRLLNVELCPDNHGQ
jgi:hypothetical protein